MMNDHSATFRASGRGTDNPLVVRLGETDGLRSLTKGEKTTEEENKLTKAAHTAARARDSRGWRVDSGPMQSSDEPTLALDAPPGRTLDDLAPDQTATDDSLPQHLRAKPAARPKQTDYSTSAVTYDVGSEIKVPAFDPDALMKSVIKATNAEKQANTMEKEIDELVLKGMYAGKGLTPEVAGMKGVPGVAMLQRTEAMEAKGRRLAGVLEQYVKFPPQPIEVHYEILGGDTKDCVPVVVTPRSRKASLAD